MTTIPAISARRPCTRLIRLPEVMLLTGLARSTIYSQMKKGPFPQQARTNGIRMAAWYEDEIIDWIESGRNERILRPVQKSPGSVRPRDIGCRRVGGNLGLLLNDWEQALLVAREILREDLKKTTAGFA